MHSKLNWRFLLKLAAVLLVAGITVHLVHRWQVRSQVGVFLQHADAARDAGDGEREESFLRRYVRARPSDLDTRERLARLVCANAKSGKAMVEGYLLVEDVLRRDPKRDDLRRYAIDFAMDPRLAMFSQAQANIEDLLKTRPNDGELEVLYARCSTAQGKYAREGSTDGAVEWYAKAIEHRPDLVDAYGARAFILRLHLNRTEESDATIKAMIGKNPNDFRTHLLLAQYWRTFFDRGREAMNVAMPVAEAQKLNPGTTVAQAAAKAVAVAQQLAPDELDVIILAADVARDRGRALAREGKPEERKQAFAEARQLLERGIAKHPKSPNVYLAMAALVAEVEKPSAAVEVVRKGLTDDAAPDSSELALALLDYQVLAGDAAGAAQTLDSLRSKGLAPAQAEYQQARILALEDKWLEASRVLERTRQDVLDNPGLARQIHLLLGRCYEQLGEDDRRLDAYRQALPVDPTDPLWVPAVLGIAEAEAALGRAEDALTTYRKLKDRAPGAWVQVARLEMIRALRADPKGKPDWRATEEALAQAERVLPDATDVLILRADLLHFQGKPAEARKRLEDLRDKRPKEAAVWVALATQDLRDKEPARAAVTLDAAEKEAGDSPDLRLARARLWAAAKESDLADKLKKLADGSEKFSGTQRRRLLGGLAQIATAAGAADAAGRFWEQLAGLRPDDLGVQLIRFDQALRAGDVQAIDQVLGDVRRIDGEGGPSTRLTRAMALIWKAQHKADPSGLDEALALLEGLARERAGWARVSLGQAMAHDLKGNADAALTKYQEAVGFGESNPSALRRLMQLLYAKRRYGEAGEILRKLPDAASANPEVQRLAADVALRTDNPKQALKFALGAVPADSKDPRDHIWLGGVYESAGERVKADASFRKAVELRPDSSDGWLVLVQHLAATGRGAEAEKALGEGGEKVSQPDRALFLALGHAQLGQTAKAVASFERARAERPDDLRTAQAEAAFLFQVGRLPDARKAYERVIGLPAASTDDKEAARQMLAICLAADPNYETSRQALELLGPLQGGGSATDQQTPTRRRSRAIVLALQKDRGSKQEAIRLLEGLRDAMTPSDRFLLAQLHAAVGNRPQVRVVLAELLQKADTVPLYVAYYAGWLLREGDIGAAQDWVKRLEQLQPDALQTAELKARLAAARKDLKTARAVLRPWAEAKGAPIARIAAIYEKVGLHDEAEGLLKRFVEENKKAQPQTVLALAAFYGRRGRTADALQICDAARPTVPAPVVGQVAVGALYANPAPAAADVSRVAGWLEEAAGTATGDARGILIQQLASVRNLQGDYAASAALYAKAIAANRRDALAMNNLAYLLSAREGKHDDALRLLDQAKQVLGPSNPDLLDTEALVRLNKGEADTAHKLLEGVVAQAPTGTAYFHLAQAEQELKRDLEARLAWRKAEELSLRRAELHPLERPAYDRMAERMR